MRILTDFADQAVLLPLILAVGTILLALGWGCNSHQSTSE